MHDSVVSLFATAAVPPAPGDPCADPLQQLRLAPFHLDDAAIAWVDSTRQRLDTRAQLHQLFNVSLHGEAAADVAQVCAWQTGGVTRFVGPDLDAAWQATRSVLQAGLDTSGIPPLISGDIEGGAISLACGTPMPNPLGLAAAGDPAVTARVAAVMAREARALGYRWSFSPVLDINAAHRSAIVATRSFGSRLDTIEALATAMARAFADNGLAATAKHWPGEGFDDRDQHLVTTQIPLTQADWAAHFGRLYRRLIDAGVPAIMAGHIGWPAYARSQGVEGLEACAPASVSPLLLQRLLRGTLGFNGIIVSDATAMAGLGAWGPRAETVPQVFAAGCDMLLFPAPFPQDLQHTLDALRDGRLSEARVWAALTRVLGLKAALGLHRATLDDLLPPLDQARALLHDPAHARVQQEACAASVTLVKDVQGLLPLHPARHRRVVLVTDPQRGGFAFQAPLPLLLPGWLAERGFDVRAFDPADPPTPDNCDLVLYVLAQESLLGQANIYLDWKRVHGPALRPMMQRYWHQLPCLLVSFGHPYYLYDAPRMPCVVNAYSAIEPVQRAVLAALLGEAPFTGGHPVDATCGLPDAAY